MIYKTAKLNSAIIQGGSQVNLAKNLFICVCMVVISTCLSYAVWAYFQLSGFEASMLGVGILVVQLVGYLLVWKAIIYRALTSRIHDLTLAEANNANGVERISNELQGLRKTLKNVSRAEMEPLARELEAIGTLIKQVAESTAAIETRLDTLEVERAPSTNASADLAPRNVTTGNDRSHVSDTATNSQRHDNDKSSDANKRKTPHENAETGRWLDEAMASPEEVRNSPLTEVENQILKAVRSAIDNNQVDLYLQPIVTLPQRKPKFYEALSRIRSVDGELIRPAQFLASAEQSGTMPIIDKMLLVRAIQVLRRLLERKSDAIIVCNISSASLSDNSFFNDFRKLLSVKSDLANHLIFEFDQATVNSFDTLEEESLRSLKNLGFHFAIDNVKDLSLDFKKLVDLGFQYVKVSAQVLLAAKKTGINDIQAEDIPRYLSRNGLELVVDHVENESEIIELLEFDISYGQGFLFAAPREIKSDAAKSKRRASETRVAG